MKRLTTRSGRSTLTTRDRRSAAACLGAAAAAWLMASAGSASAVDRTWVGLGGDDNWTTGGNWAGGTAPSASDVLFFDGVNRLTPTNNFLANTQFNGLGFNANAGLFTVGGNDIVLGGDILDRST